MIILRSARPFAVTAARVVDVAAAPAATGRPGAAAAFAPLAGPAPVAAPAAVASAVDGALRLVLPGTRGPIVDFPGVQAGQEFDIVKGSKVGFFGGIKGAARIDAFTPDLAVFHVKAGKFGVKVDVEVRVERIDDTHVRISSKGSGIPDQSAIGEVVESRTDHAEFRIVDMDLKNTVIRRDGANGQIVIDTEVPNFGDAHLVLVPKQRAALGLLLLAGAAAAR